MLSIQHVLMNLYQSNCNIDEMLLDLKYVLLPDALRFFINPRQYTHFERSPDKQDVSWLQFPIDLKSLSKEVLKQSNKYLSNKIVPCCLGEETDITAFEIANRHLPQDYFYGIKKHLIQDQEFDIYIRKLIDCSDMYDNDFYYNEEYFNDAQIRNLIFKIEQYGICVLSQLIYEKSNHTITTNQKWFEENIKPYLFSAYPEELAENTYKYMIILPEFDKIITNHSWELLNNFNFANLPDYINLYNKIFNRINNECIKKINENFALDNIFLSLKELSITFNEKIKFDEYKNLLFDNMHKELMEFKNNVNEKNVEIMALDIIQLLDIYTKIVNKAKNSEINNESYKNLLNNFEGILQDLLDVLYRQNIEPYKTEDDTINVKKQKIVSTIKTNDESLNNKLASKNAPGYEKNGKILRPERISIFKYEKENKNE